MDDSYSNERNSHDAALVLGILSIVFLFICQIAGLIMGIIGLRKAGKRNSSSSTDTAWVLNVIGIVLNAVILFLIIVAIIFGIIVYTGFVGHTHYMW